MIKPKVSVLMPIYNTPLNHLAEAIESILQQTFTDFEFLIVNDSPDNVDLDNLVQNFNDKRIRYFKNEKNQGLEFSTNFLIKQARGEYLAIFDHDDISLPERLEKEVVFLDANPDHGMVSGQFEVFGVESWVSQNPLSDTEIKELLKTTSCVSHTSLMIRTETLYHNKIHYEKKFFPAASYRVITRLAAVAKVANLPDLVLKYRMDGNNTSLKFADKRLLARKKIQIEYRNELRRQNLISTEKFDKVELIKTDSMSSGDNHYCAEKSGKKFFIKESIYSFVWEFEATKRAFEQDKDFFSKPVEAFEKNGWNYLVLEWEDGQNLAKFLKENKLTNKQKKNFTTNLETILRDLHAAKLVHRDIIPRNFMVVGDKLKLIDFYFAVDFDNYKEYDYIENDISLISELGEDFSKGHFLWDDAYSISKIIEFIGYEVPDNLLKLVGKTTISPKIEIFSKNIVKRRDEVVNLIKIKDTLKSEIIDKNKHINELHEEIKRLREEKEKIVNSKTYRVGVMLAGIYKKIKF